jgi:hypothetical protein
MMAKQTIAQQPFGNLDSYNHLVITTRSCLNCAFVERFAIDVKYYFFNDHMGALDIC